MVSDEEKKRLAPIWWLWTHGFSFVVHCSTTWVTPICAEAQECFSFLEIRALASRRMPEENFSRVTVGISKDQNWRFRIQIPFRIKDTEAVLAPLASAAAAARRSNPAPRRWVSCVAAATARNCRKKYLFSRVWFLEKSSVKGHKCLVA